MLHTLIIYFGLQIIFSESPRVECGSKYEVSGCLMGNVVVLGYNSPNLNGTLYHEIGHRLFRDDQEVKDLISQYPAPRVYPDYAYPTDDMKLNERVADYYSMFSIYPDFPDKFPKIKELFDLKLSQINK